MIGEETVARATTSYRQSLKATSLTGASSLVVVFVQMVKVKVVAVALGPAGTGLLGILGSIAAVATQVASLGIASSGAREVAAAIATKDDERIARVVFVLRRVSLLLGGLGGLAIAVFSRPLCRLSLGSTEQANALALLGLVVFFNTVNGGQNALLRGKARIRDLAELRIWGAFLGTAVAIPFVLKWGLKGLVPALVVVAAAANVASWVYARRIRLAPFHPVPSELLVELRSLVGLGAVFLSTGLLATATAYAMRTILVRSMDLSAVGQFQAAVGFSDIYAGFILQAMGLDFLPRLTAVAQDNAACNQLVNEQTQIGILLAGPGLIATVVLAPILIPLIYSSRFTEAIPLLRWQCLGVLLQVASFPLKFILIAKGSRMALLLTDVAKQALHLFFFWLLLRLVGLTGAVIGFASMNVLYLAMIYGVARRETEFSAASKTLRVLAVIGGGFGVALASSVLMAERWAAVVGLVAMATTFVWTYRELCRRLDMPLARAVVDRLSRLRPKAWGRRGGSAS